MATPQKLVVDVHALADLGVQLGRIRDDFDHVDTVTAGVDSYVGDPGIAAALGDFADNWSDKREQIATLLGTTATSVTRAAAAYEAAEDRSRRHVGHDPAPPPDLHHVPGGGTTQPAPQPPASAPAHPAPGAGGTAGAAAGAASGPASAVTAGSSGSGDAGGATAGGSDPLGSDPSTSAQVSGAQVSGAQVSGSGSIADSGSGSVGLAASGSGGDPAASEGHSNHSVLDHTAAMAAPVGVLGVAGAAAWGAQRRKDQDEEEGDDI